MSNELPKNVHSVLTDIKHFIEQEQELFGATMHAEYHTKTKQETVPGAVEILPSDILWQHAVSVEGLNGLICNCRQCPLGATRTKFVFGVGNPKATLMIIGEAPGADEDAQGEPFVGRAGQLLNRILEAVKFKREEVYIANILKCRPPNNRRPNPSEVEQCEPYLWRQIELIQPAIILCLGLTAAQTLLHTTASMGNLRTATHSYRNIPVIVTYHPAALLRNPGWKRPTWEDVQKLRALHDELIHT